MSFNDLYILKNYKTDGDIGFVLIFKVSKNNWLAWCPSDNQMYVLKQIDPKIIWDVVKHNKKNRKVSPEDNEKMRRGWK